MLTSLMQQAISHSLEDTGLNLDQLTAYLADNTNDRRYKPSILASTSHWSKDNASGVVKYRGRRFYYHCINGKVAVEAYY